MSKHGRFNIRRWRDDRTGREGITFWCHGCQEAHSIGTSGPGPCWSFNGDYDNPVLSPSVRVYIPAGTDPDDGEAWPEKTLCHCFVGTSGAQPGQIIFLDDSAGHNQRGVHNMEPWPDYYGAAGES